MAVLRIKELAAQDEALANGLKRLSRVLAETEDAKAGPNL
jgi:hypothetical protein